MARKGLIEPNSKYLSKGIPLERAEKFCGPTTLFRGQKVRKAASKCLYFSLNIFADFVFNPLGSGDFGALEMF